MNCNNFKSKLLHTLLTLSLNLFLDLHALFQSTATFVTAKSFFSTPLAFQYSSAHTHTNTSSSRYQRSSLSFTKKVESDIMASSIPLEKLTNFANSFAAANGLQVESKKSSSVSSSYQCAPISLLPNIFPAKAFHKAQSLAPDFNLLVDKISRNYKFLNDTLAGGEFSVTSKDPYTKKLLQLYNDIYGNNYRDQKGKDGKPNFAHLADKLGIQRSDYMLNPSSSLDGFELKQVELNTIAASFAGLATGIAKLHSLLTTRFAHELDDWIQMNSKKVMGEDYALSHKNNHVGVPNNTALDKLAYAMSVSHERYKSRFIHEHGYGKGSSPTAAILFIVQDGETNTVDQRKLEFQLWEGHQIPVVRMSLTVAHTQLKLDANDGALYILDDDQMIEYQVSLVYYRAGYAPTDYPDGYDGIEWKSREKIERSRATKCPSLGYHLAGTKKVQQELARPGVLEQFFDDGDEKIESMREAFAGLYSLGDDAMTEDIDAIKDVLSGSAGKYVLKPQREGGGYNYYGDRLTDKIKENVKVNDDNSVVLGEDLAEFILMQRLFPPKQTAVLLRAGIVEGSGETISELGCFGTIVQSFDGLTLHNEYAGFLLRTKFENVDEGGVASGFATLSSPYLC